MNWVDLTVVGVALVSGIVGLTRGFVREALGIGAWVGAGYLAVVLAPFVAPKAGELLGGPDYAMPAAYTVSFIVTLIILTMLAGWIGSLAHRIGLGGLDRSLGAVFGLARGFGIVVLAYIVAGLVVPANRWPDAVRQARLLPYVSDAAKWVSDQLPQNYKPSMPNFANDQPIRLPQLLQAPAVGRARP